jgi:hypothetical protein
MGFFKASSYKTLRKEPPTSSEDKEGNASLYRASISSEEPVFETVYLDTPKKDSHICG